MVKSMSPTLTFCPTATATEATTPGIGAPIWPSFAGSALGRAAVCALTRRFGTRITRGWPFSSKNTLTSPVSSVSPMACRRISSVLPGSISAAISSPGSMP